MLIENGKILWIRGSEAAAPSAEVIEGSGRTLLPGLFDAHVHMPYNAAGAARQALMLGVTTQLDMASAGQGLKNIKKLEAEDRADLSDLRTAGNVATVPGGHPAQMGGPPLPTLTGANEAAAFVDARIQEGSDYIKIIHDDGSTWPWTKDRVPMLDNSTMRALVAAAHNRGKLAVVHVLSEQQARDAMEGRRRRPGASIFRRFRFRRFCRPGGEASRIRHYYSQRAIWKLRQVDRLGNSRRFAPRC